jgi:hypothetical protein
MVVRVDQKLIDLDGQEMKDAKNVPATLGSILVEVLLVQLEDEKNLSGEEKLKRWELAFRIKKATSECEMSVGDIALAKKLVGKAYSPAVVGPVWNMLENKPALEVIK